MKHPAAIIIHGGAGHVTKYIKENQAAYESGLKTAVMKGYDILLRGGTALDAVETAIISLEDNELFNCARGSALNYEGKVEMDAALMDGSKRKAGAVSMIRNVRNPISLARKVMEKTNHVYIAGSGALQLALSEKLKLEEDDYFITPHQEEEYRKTHKKESIRTILKKFIGGTVGAVAVDCKGHVASGTSTGGEVNNLPGRVGDSCIIGAGCYANDATCAISCTGDGEFLITGVIANSISKVKELTGCSLQEACDRVIHRDNKGVKGDLGAIALTPGGDMGIAFNSERMHRAWISPDGHLHIKIYKE